VVPGASEHGVQILFEHVPPANQFQRGRTYALHVVIDSAIPLLDGAPGIAARLACRGVLGNGIYEPRIW
jgi:hypothetical protein